MASEAAGTVKQELRRRALSVEQFLENCLRECDTPETLLQAMEYSLLGGGKRLRPCLCLTVAELFGLDQDAAMPFAAAFECIHTYSLIHDDLPAMDDDDLRRGKPSCHKAFGEAQAILAGDGLNTEAFRLMAQARAPGENVVRAIYLAAEAAGAAGMVGGQVLDMQYTGKQAVTLEMLRAMHAQKTGALIRAACECGAALAGASLQDQARLRDYGAALGVAFQIVDDILDEVGDEKTLGKPVGSDREQGKTTYVTLVGLEQSRELANVSKDAALAALEPFADRPQAAFLTRLTQFVVDRAY